MAKGLPRSRSRGNPQHGPGIHKKRYYARGLTLSITDPGSANAPFTGILGELPEGNVLLLGAVANLQLTRGDTDISATFTGNVALGTAPTADATLNGSEVNIIPSTAITTAVAGVSPTKRYASTGTESGVVLDNTDGSLEVNINGFIADAAISADSSIIVDGWIELSIVMMGDD